MQASLSPRRLGPMPRTVLPDARVFPRFSGITTFCRYPRLEDVAPENRPVDWAIFGVPFDAGVTYLGKSWEARLGVLNIFDKDYVTVYRAPAHAVNRGEPRTYTLALSLWF